MSDNSPATDRPAQLLGQWLEHLRAAGSPAPDGVIVRMGEELLGRWAEPHRHYHDVEHLAEILDAVALLEAHAQDATAVRLAAWFHDAVYQGRPGADEDASAVLAERVLAELGVVARTVTVVTRLVRLTTGHDPAPGDLDGAVLCDADLAVLASGRDRYARYAEAVRAEYAQVPAGAFRAGRLAVLRDLEASPLFRTATARQRWESAARANLAAEIADVESRRPQ